MDTMGAGASIGRIDSRGILPRALKQLFDDDMGDVAISYYEILKDETCTKPKVVDLLVPGGKELPVKLDKSQTAIQGLSRTSVRNESEALATVASGSKLRSTESTLRNQKSSRSHAILVFHLSKAGIERKLSLVYNEDPILQNYEIVLQLWYFPPSSLSHLHNDQSKPAHNV